MRQVKTTRLFRKHIWIILWVFGLFLLQVVVPHAHLSLSRKVSIEAIDLNCGIGETFIS